MPYTAPETFATDRISKATDVYAFGILRAPPRNMHVAIRCLAACLASPAVVALAENDCTCVIFCQSSSPGLESRPGLHSLPALSHSDVLRGCAAYP